MKSFSFLNNKFWNLILTIFLSLTLINNIGFSPNSSIIRASSAWTQTSDMDFQNGTLNNLTINRSGNEAKIEFNVSENGGWKYFQHNIPMSKLVNFGMSSVYDDDKVVVHGGLLPSFDGSNGTWIFDLSDNTWSRKLPKTATNKRILHSLAPIFGTDKVLLFGGWVNADYVNDTWIYDVSDNDWTEIFPNNMPSERGEFALASIYGDDKVLLFGGKNFTGDSDETWVYDFSDNDWTLKTPSNPPSARNNHAMATIFFDDKILLFGGFDGNYDDETWIYDLTLDAWSKQTVSQKPEKIHKHKMAPISTTGNILLFGGKDFSNYYGDTWIYYISNNTWIKKTNINPLDKPSPRTSFGLSPVNGTNKIIFYAGANTSWQNDTWIFDYLPELRSGTFISDIFDIGQNSSFISIDWDGDLYVDTDLKFQIRTAKTQFNLTNKLFVGPDGTVSTYYETTPSNIWSGHIGDRWIQIKAYLSMKLNSETPNLKNFRIIYNCHPFTELIGPMSASYTNDNTPVFSWNFIDTDSSQQEDFQILISSDFKFNNTEFNIHIQDSANNNWEFPIGTSYTSIPDGTWFWKVRTKDSDGVWSEFTQPWEIIIDTEQPDSNITFPIKNSFHNNIASISGTANDNNGSGIERIDLTIQRQSDFKFWNGSNWVDSIEWLLVQGTTDWNYDIEDQIWENEVQYLLKSRAIDNASNIEDTVEMCIINIDSENVSFSNIVPNNNVEAPSGIVKVGITISDIGSGVNGSSIEYCISTNDGITWSTWTTISGFDNSNMINVLLNLSFPNGSANRIKWRALDVVGNGPNESEAFSISVNVKSEISLPIVTLVYPMNNTVISTLTVNLSWLLNFEIESGITYDVIMDLSYPPKKIIKHSYKLNSLIVEGLNDGNTYYWTIIPKIGNNNGSCTSGIWSFGVNTSIQIPKVLLNYPKNGSIINTLKPTFSWSVETNAFKNLIYNFYLDTTSNPKNLTASITTTEYIPSLQLDYNITYYWKVIPQSGSFLGSESEIWSFTIKSDFTPNFDFELSFSKTLIEIEPGKNSSIKGYVTNLGDINDSISIDIIPFSNNDVEVTLIIFGPKDIEPEGLFEFEIIISVKDNSASGFVNITLQAVSNMAQNYGITILKNSTFTIKILSKNDESSPDEISEQDDSFTFILGAVVGVVIIIIILILLFLFMKKRDKELHKEDSIEEHDVIQPIETKPPDSSLTDVGDSTPQIIDQIQPPDRSTYTQTTVSPGSEQDTEKPVQEPTQTQTTPPIPLSSQIPEPMVQQTLPPPKIDEQKTDTESKLTPQQKIALLEQRFKQSEISEKLYLSLKAEFERE